MAGAQQQHSGWLAGDLLGSLGLPDGAWQQAPVAGLSMDSRNIGQDDLFLAVAGSQRHGLEHLQQALDQGASLVLTEASSAWPLERICRLKHSVPIVVMDSLRPAVSEIAARFYAHHPENRSPWCQLPRSAILPAMPVPGTGSRWFFHWCP